MSVNMVSKLCATCSALLGRGISTDVTQTRSCDEGIKPDIDLANSRFSLSAYTRFTTIWPLRRHRFLLPQSSLDVRTTSYICLVSASDAQINPEYKNHGNGSRKSVVESPMSEQAILHVTPRKRSEMSCGEMGRCDLMTKNLQHKSGIADPMSFEFLQRVGCRKPAKGRYMDDCIPHRRPSPTVEPDLACYFQQTD
ncbi:uncharacterized protein PV07_07370 [Cladophialophora immunda]|uniref:Uncharacterized protein n=1 Tax=Cladophialophora immunda TaxID=569365 RepID=A0A0D1ZI54_9EURO|nr:uncharacterized protein PV07_07370 [Cladophialophora immunda]KIW27646.1 hypothetical protein PV07_07370 [Cladophialophora immunda]OQU97283.1 hypothetical protein CLAIMM_03236 isoform 1 [Cladophialophora immunda]